MKIVVIGAGAAGLTCARTLLRAGLDVQVLEASDGVGGRVRSDTVDGFTLDRGFQVLFTAYPAAQRQLNYARLDLRRFAPGALIAQGTRRHTLSDPFRDPAALAASVLSPIVTLQDKLRTALLSEMLKRISVEAIMDAPDETTEAFLYRCGFSPRFVDNFARPFFGGVFLDRTLQTSAKAFRFDWKMLSEGDTVVPAGGIGAITEQLAEELAASGRIRLQARVAEIVRDTKTGRAIGIRTEAGETIGADAVVVATAGPEAARLTGDATPVGQVGTICLYFAGPAPVYEGRKLVLHANQGAFVNNIAQLTNVAPELAPAGQHLLSVTVLGVPALPDAALWNQARADLERLFADDKAAQAAIAALRPLRLYRIPYAQFTQPPGVYDGLPTNASRVPGVTLAGEFTAASSLNAALRSGEKAAALVLRKV